jgi:four helix bundle protein
MQSYIELEVWKHSRTLVSEIYSITKKFPQTELFGITNQMRRSAISVPSNIAEGCGRNHKKDSIQFFYIARGSIYELETQVYLCFDQNYIDEKNLNNILNTITTCKKLINGFIKYYDSLS